MKNHNSYRKKIHPRLKHKMQVSTRTKAASEIKSPPLSSTSLKQVSKAPPALESIILHYISKLKKTCQSSSMVQDPDHPTRGKRKAANVKFRDANMNKYRKKGQKVKRGSEKRGKTYSSVNRMYKKKSPPKAKSNFIIVSEIVKYGLATQVLRKCGQYFCFKKSLQKKMAGKAKSKGAGRTARPKFKRHRLIKKDKNKSLAGRNGRKQTRS